MCGIVGIFNRNGEPPDSAMLKRMTDRLAHRGPDGEGFWQENGLAFGHRRLSIRDLTPAGAQPFHSQDGRYVVVYNGEIYNENDLARELAQKVGFVRRTRCDTELIPAAYAAWGVAAFERFEGMFAIGLWDRQARILILARDAIGIKPLYLFDNGSILAFASELKALLAQPQIPRRISSTEFAHMLALGYPTPTRTLLDGVGQIAPGTVRIIGRETSREHAFWKPRRVPVSNVGDAVEEFVDLVGEVVSDQLISDVPLGIMQSGGIDSSIISLSLPKDKKAPLFSVRFNEKSHDESASVEAFAKATNREVFWVDLPDGSDLLSDFRATVTAVDGQLGDSSALAMGRLSGALRQHVKVALSGDGADEFFGGYPTYHASALASWLQCLSPKVAWRSAARLIQPRAFGDGRLPLREKIYRFLYGLSQDIPHASWRHYLPAWQRIGIYGQPLMELIATDPLQEYSNAFSSASGGLVDRALIADQSFYLPADMLVKTDRCSMMHGLEVRVPFLDRRIMEFAGSLSYDPSGETKPVLRETLRRIGGPTRTVVAPKRGFNIPMNRHLRNGLKPLADRIMDRDADIFAPHLKPDGVRALWRGHNDGGPDEKYAIWTLLTIGLWCEQEKIG